MSVILFGTPGWDRTNDLRLRSPLLYPLSYRGTLMCNTKGTAVWGSIQWIEQLCLLYISRCAQALATGAYQTIIP